MFLIVLCCCRSDKLNSVFVFFLSIVVESPIDGVAWSEQGKFLVVGENNGGLHLLDSESHQILFSQVSEDFGNFTLLLFFFTAV